MGKIVFIFCFLTYVVQAQGYEITYEIIGKHNKEKEQKSIDQAILSYNVVTESSIYLDVNIASRGKDFLENFRKQNETHFHDIILKNFKPSQYTQLSSIDEEYYQHRFTFPSHNWQLQQESKIILDYLCQKATIDFGNRKWTAWFTTKIPINDGPYKFFGLPGLILEIISADGDYHFKVREIKKTTTNSIVNLPNSISVDENKFKKLQNQIVKDPSFNSRNLMLNSSYKSKSSFDGKEFKTDKNYFDSLNKIYWKWMKDHNNPIEMDKVWLK